MRWTLGLLLLGAVGCGGYRQTRMVACPDTGCPPTYAESSPEGLKGPREKKAPPPMDPVLQAPPLTPEPDTAPPPVPPPVESP